MKCIDLYRVFRAVKVYYANEWEYDENGNPKVK